MSKWLINKVLEFMKCQEMHIESSALISPKTGKNKMSDNFKFQ